MEYYQRVRITIICESILEEKIIDAIKKEGVHGYTILEARGGGSRGERYGDFEFNKNVKIEIVCKQETADTLCEKIHEKYFQDYAVVVYKSEVEVLRSDKFN